MVGLPILPCVTWAQHALFSTLSLVRIDCWGFCCWYCGVWLFVYFFFAKIVCFMSRLYDKSLLLLLLLLGIVPTLLLPHPTQLLQDCLRLSVCLFACLLLLLLLLLLFLLLLPIPLNRTRAIMPGMTIMNIGSSFRKPARMVAPFTWLIFFAASARCTIT